jgi:hypothetical protein
MTLSLLRHLADRSLQVCLPPTRGNNLLPARMRLRGHVSVILTASGADRRSLLKLSIGKPGRFRAANLRHQLNINM